MTRYSYSGRVANLGPSERHPGQWTRAAQVLKACWEDHPSSRELAEMLGIPSNNISLILTKLRAQGLIVNRWGCTRVTDAGRAEAERLFSQQKKVS